MSAQIQLVRAMTTTTSSSKNGLIDQGPLITAVAAWMRNKGRSRADHLILST